MPTPSRKPSTATQLSDLQLSVMQALWQRGEATVVEVQSALEGSRGLAMTTVATLLSRLEKRGLVAHHNEGRVFIYRAAVTEQDIRRHVVTRVADRLFRGDVTELVCHLLRVRDLAPEDLERVKALIREREEPERSDDASSG
jgi:predicted transcriptional regulator